LLNCQKKKKKKQQQQKDWKTNNGSSGGSGLSSSGPSNAVSKQKRRTRVPDKPNYPLNLWSIMKNCIGKELSKIPMPVNFSEPLSMLQRLTEDYEYAEILDRSVGLIQATLASIWIAVCPCFSLIQSTTTCLWQSSASNRRGPDNWLISSF
jgi:hypothetical protein